MPSVQNGDCFIVINSFKCSAAFINIFYIFNNIDTARCQVFFVNIVQL